jgi:hypothetical protein
MATALREAQTASIPGGARERRKRGRISRSPHQRPRAKVDPRRGQLLECRIEDAGEAHDIRS